MLINFDWHRVAVKSLTFSALCLPFGTRPLDPLRLDTQLLEPGDVVRCWRSCPSPRHRNFLTATRPTASELCAESLFPRRAVWFCLRKALKHVDTQEAVRLWSSAGVDVISCHHISHEKSRAALRLSSPCLYTFNATHFSRTDPRLARLMPDWKDLSKLATFTLALYEVFQK